MVGQLAFTLAVLMIGSGALSDPGSMPILRMPGLRAPEIILALNRPDGPVSLTGSRMCGPAGPVELEGSAPFSTPSVWPVKGWIVRGFGPPAEGGSGRFHPGINIASRAGTPVKAPASGVVIAAGRDPRMGPYLILDHGRGLTTRLGNIRAERWLRPGVRVRRGQIIGSLAQTAVPSLHYEVRVAGVPVDPGRYLPCWSTTR